MSTENLALQIGTAVIVELEKIKVLPAAEQMSIGRVVLRAQIEMIDAAGSVKGANFTVALDGYGSENPRLLFPTS